MQNLQREILLQFPMISLARNAGAVIHTHSKVAVLVTLLYGNEFRLSHFEMIKVRCIYFGTIFW